jgi:hypothetical protein
MITTDQLNKPCNSQLAAHPHFLVHAEVRPSGKAIVEVDMMTRPSHWPT